MPEKIEISSKTIIFTVFFLIFLWFLYQIRQIILLLFVSFIAMAALNPLVDKIEKAKIPRPLAIIIIYITIFGFLSVILASIVPVVINQTSYFFANLPKIIQKFNLLNIPIQLSDYSSELAKIPLNALKLISNTFSNILRVFTFGVITFYLLMERRNLKKYLKIIFKREGEKRAEEMITKLEIKIGGWVRGQIFLMIIVGLLTYLGLVFLDIDFAVPLAVLAGLFEIIPNIGPVLSMIPAIIVGFSVSPLLGLAVVALYFIVQQLENNLIVPKVMQKSAGIHPLATLISLMIGLKLNGALGMFLAVPVFLTIKVLLEEVYKMYSSLNTSQN